MFMRWRKMTRRPVWSRYIPSSAERRQMLMPQKPKPDQRFQRFHHRDLLRRPYSGRRDTRFLNPKDGRPTELVVQSSEEVLDNKSGADWARKSIDDKGPWVFRVAHWATADGVSSIARWLPACAVLSIVVSTSCQRHMNIRTDACILVAKSIPRHNWNPK